MKHETEVLKKIFFDVSVYLALTSPLNDQICEDFFQLFQETRSFLQVQFMGLCSKNSMQNFSVRVTEILVE